MARHPGPAQLRSIEGAFSDADRDVRATALTLVAGIDAERGRGMALKALDDSDGVVRAAAIRVLGPPQDQGLLARVTSLASLDPVWQVRRAALEAIAGADVETVRAAYEQGIVDANREVRHASLAGGASHPGLLSTGALARVLKEDADWENRVLAAEILGASSDPEAYAFLDEAVLDPHEFVRAEATRARQALLRSGVPRPTPPPAPPASPAPDTTKRKPGV